MPVTIQDLVDYIPANVRSTLKVLDFGHLVAMMLDSISNDKLLELEQFKALVNLRIAKVHGIAMEQILETVGPQLETLEIMGFGVQVEARWQMLIQCSRLTRVYLPYRSDVWKAICQLNGLVNLGMTFNEVEAYPTSVKTMDHHFLQSKQIQTLTFDYIHWQILVCDKFWEKNPWQKVN